MIASAKEIDALNITLFNSCINFTNVHCKRQECFPLPL